MSVSKLFCGCEYRIVCGENAVADLGIRDVSSDSRTLEKDSLFIAKRGGAGDGHDYLTTVLAQGCGAIVVQAGCYDVELFGNCSIPVFEMTDTVRAYGKIVANFYGNPAEKLRLIAVTGTNGKTTISYLLEDLLSRTGRQVGVIGTVNNRYKNVAGKTVTIPTALTTPDAKVIQGLLAQMVAEGVDDVIMETSSHAIEQGRIEPLLFDVCAFTNLSRDHLDYHGDMDAYFHAKKGLFTHHIKQGGTAVLPNDNNALTSCYRQELIDVSPKSLLWGRGEGADVRLLSHSLKLEESLCSVRYRLGDSEKDLEFSTPLVGDFNIDNLLTVIAVAIALGLDYPTLASTIPSIHGAPGRLQRVVDPTRTLTAQPVVFVDYAHTPDALEKLLSTLGELPHKRLISVFGCGGNRDRGKRPLMGAIGAQLSHIAIITEDNPRKEASAQIFSDIEAGIVEAGYTLLKDEDDFSVEAGGAWLIANRHEAIERAVSIAEPGDIVAIAGKGHEPYQLGPDGKIFFDDSLEALKVLCRWTVDKIVQATGGQLVGQDSSQALQAVVTDSRKVQRGDIFVALRGETHDAHQFLAQVDTAGAGCMVVEEADPNLSCPQIVVGDSLVALGALAHFWLQGLRACVGTKVVGITGSSGKTTIKEMTAAIARTMYPDNGEHPAKAVVKTQGNFNNLIGLPLSILPMDAEAKLAILEMGMNAPGEITKLSHIAEPDIVCIGNVHGAHLLGLGSIEGVAKAKEEIFAEAGEKAQLVINLDDPFVAEMAKRYSQEKICFSVDHDKNADLWAEDIKVDRDGYISFDLCSKKERARVNLHTFGAHNVANALAAASIGCFLGARHGEIVEGLQSYTSPGKRMEKLSIRSGWTLISDCYNANPASMSAGLRTLATIGDGKKIAVVGDMFELGAAADGAHYKIGLLAGELKLDFIAAVGEFADRVCRGAMDAGLADSQVASFTSKDELAQFLLQKEGEGWMKTGDVVLFKASRGMALETLIGNFVAVK